MGGVCAAHGGRPGPGQPQAAPALVVSMHVTCTSSSWRGKQSRLGTRSRDPTRNALLQHQALLLRRRGEAARTDESRQRRCRRRPTGGRSSASTPPASKRLGAELLRAVPAASDIEAPPPHHRLRTPPAAARRTGGGGTTVYARRREISSAAAPSAAPAEPARRSKRTASERGGRRDPRRLPLRHAGAAVVAGPSGARWRASEATRPVCDEALPGRATVAGWLRSTFGLSVCGFATCVKPCCCSGGAALLFFVFGTAPRRLRAPRRWRKPPPSPSCAFATGASSAALLNEAPN